MTQSGPYRVNINYMSTNNSIPWKRTSAEGITIVVSIILAFAIDAWWDERQERQDEREFLDRLHAELSVNIERIDRVGVFRTLKIEYAVDLVDLIAEAQTRGDKTIDVPVVILMHLADSSTFEADIPVLEGLIRSGRLEIIENQIVLAAIAKWESGLRNYTEVAVRERQNTDNRFLPALYARGDVAQVLMRLEGSAALNAEPDPHDVTTLHIDNQLKAIVAERTENARRSWDILNEARMAAVKARESIAASK